MILSWYSFSSKPRFKDCFSRFKGKFKVTTIPPDDQENALKNAGEIVADGLNKGRRDNSLGTAYQLARDAGVSLKGDGWKADWEVYRYEGHDEVYEKVVIGNFSSSEDTDNQSTEKRSFLKFPISRLYGGVSHPRAINKQKKNE
jgi:hypothetical protein